MLSVVWQTKGNIHGLKLCCNTVYWTTILFTRYWVEGKTKKGEKFPLLASFFSTTLFSNWKKLYLSVVEKGRVKDPWLLLSGIYFNLFSFPPKKKTQFESDIPLCFFRGWASLVFFALLRCVCSKSHIDPKINIIKLAFSFRASSKTRLFSLQTLVWQKLCFSWVWTEGGRTEVEKKVSIVDKKDVPKYVIAQDTENVN